MQLCTEPPRRHHPETQQVYRYIYNTGFFLLNCCSQQQQAKGFEFFDQFEFAQSRTILKEPGRILSSLIRPWFFCENTLGTLRRCFCHLDHTTKRSPKYKTKVLQLLLSCIGICSPCPPAHMGTEMVWPIFVSKSPTQFLNSQLQHNTENRNGWCLQSVPGWDTWHLV